MNHWIWIKYGKNKTENSSLNFIRSGCEYYIYPNYHCRMGCNNGFAIRYSNMRINEKCFANCCSPHCVGYFADYYRTLWQVILYFDEYLIADITKYIFRFIIERS